MEKKKILRTETPSVNTTAFTSSEPLPTGDTVDNFAASLSKQPRATKPKKETAKGTIVVNVMIDGDLYTKAKMKAFNEKVTFSSVINDALQTFL
jgi:hypothetical protein